MSFHETRFPDNIAYGVSGGPEYATTIVITASGYESRNVNWSQARGKWDAASGLKTQAQLDTLIAFFRARKGRAYGFRFKDWSDYKVAGQAIGTGNASNKNFQLVKTYTSGGVTETRTITKPVVGSVKVYLNGVQQLSGWTLNSTTGVVMFGVAPGNTVAVTADFEFDVPVRFDTDKMEISIEQYNLNQWAGIPIVEIRA